jgi:hypothetical protein
MWKVFLLSVIIGTIAIPARMSRIKNPRLGLRKAITYMVAFYAVYYFALLLVYGRL